MAIQGTLQFAFPVQAPVSSKARTKTVVASRLSPLARTKTVVASRLSPLARTKPVVACNGTHVSPPPPPSPISPPFNRRSFPHGFIFGTSSASYQYEGGAKEGGRTPSIWDTFTHKYPERIADGTNGDQAIDFYHRYKEDVKLMKELGMDAFRFSISWSRILPTGRLSGGVNPEGIKFYNNLINELLSNGLQPFVTIFHWDVPHDIEMYGGFLNPQIMNDFRDFAELCYKEFGDRVKHWITMNEPMIFCSYGYDTGAHAPGRGSAWVSPACQAGDSAIEPYKVGHHMLLCHAEAVKVYKEKYQAHQKGKIGITQVAHWMVPYSNREGPDNPDIAAAQRALDFMFGWLMEPLAHGHYPECMVERVGNRLPKFTEEQSTMVKGSYDFIGINYYTARFAADVPDPNTENLSYSTDSDATLTTERNGQPIGPLNTSTWVNVYPRGLRDLLKYTKEKYNNPIIYITENGVDSSYDGTESLKESLEDPIRIDYFYRHLLFLKKAIEEDGVDVRGHFAWSFLDNFEWNSGNTSKFGIYFVDARDELKRYPKQSALWFKEFLKIPPTRP